MASYAAYCFLFGLVSTALGACPNYWTAFEGHCYAFMHTPSTWAGASEICQEMKSQLVAVESSGENTFLKNFIKSKHQGTTEDVWMGGNDILVENNWVWENGQPMTFTDWGPSQPDNSGNIENCVCFRQPFNLQWNDWPCDKKFYFICEQKDSSGPIVG